MTSFTSGRRAEQKASEHLAGLRYSVIEQNWRTRWCEIDLVATKGDTVYFVEVKYRSTSDYGVGLDYITQQKLRQMNFAAEFWIASHQWRGKVELAAIEVAGPDYEVRDLLIL